MTSDLNNGFEKLIRNKLEDYRAPVDASSWDAIEKSLVRSKIRKYIYTATGIVAAAVVLFLITLNIPDKDIDKQPDNKPATAVSKDSTPTPAPPDRQNPIPEIKEQTAREMAEPNRQTQENQTEQEQSVSNSVPAYSAMANAVAAQTGQTDAHPEDPPVTRLEILPQTVSGTSVSISSSNKLQLPNSMHFTGNLGRKQDDKKNVNRIANDKKDIIANYNTDRSDSKKWSVSVSFGAGNYQSPNVNNRNSELITAAPLLTSSNSVDYVKNKYRDEIKVPDNADSQHGLPLSAKFSVRKDLSSRWAVESGISYTYLSTKYRWNKNTLNQQLHYIGIPLNAVCYVVSKPSWNIYVSAGGMVEKGVYAHISRSNNVAVETKMNGLQWSVNGAAGATYKLRKGLGLFFEPQVGYFFDNGQPESIRTEWPVSFGLGAGLRFNF